jgi:hypothetical protein
MHLLKMLLLENPGLNSRLIAVIAKNIPSAENQVVQVSQWHELFDLGYAILEPFTQSDGSHLGQ